MINGCRRRSGLRAGRGRRPQRPAVL